MLIINSSNYISESFAEVNCNNLIYEVQEKIISDHYSNLLYYFRNYEIFNYCYDKLY